MAKNEKTFTLPSEILNKNNHDCRPDSIKFHDRDKTYDVSILATLMLQSKGSLNAFYEAYLHRPEDIEEFFAG
jgi:hypothetical protein